MPPLLLVVQHRMRLELLYDAVDAPPAHTLGRPRRRVERHRFRHVVGIAGLDDHLLKPGADALAVHDAGDGAALGDGAREVLRLYRINPNTTYATSAPSIAEAKTGYRFAPATIPSMRSNRSSNSFDGRRRMVKRPRRATAGTGFGTFWLRSLVRRRGHHPVFLARGLRIHSGT